MDDGGDVRSHDADGRAGVNPAVRMSGITKRFGSVTALQSVDLTVAKGVIHGVVGENGAGKTTLMRILYGALQPDEGQIALDGRSVHFRATTEAIAAGVGMVSQHYGILPELTCLENLILGAEGGRLIDSAAAEARAEDLASRMGFAFDWRAEAATLSPAAAQKLEILKLLWRDSKIMILDEPTAMLSPADGDALFRSLGELARAGATIILVTHRLPEVMAHCSHVTVLRGGRTVADMPVAETTAPELAKLIVGGKLHVSRPLTEQVQGDIVLDARSLTNTVNLAVRAGEMVGIAGVDGSGQRELFDALLGVTKVRDGSISLAGKDITHQPTSARIEHGMRLIPEDRHSSGLIESWSMEENAALGLQRLAPFARGQAIDTKGRREAAATIADRFKTKHGGLSMPLSSLSGGNQQRFVAARALFLDPKVILAFQPARGLDVNGTEALYSAIRDACQAGGCAIVVSFDLDELLEHCDRILVMYRGQLLEPGPGHENDRDAIGRLMVGAA